MPSKVFLNLNEEKRQKIIRAAINEFTSHVYEDVQVKRIVEEVGIARGSFYQYFEDVEDLFVYILKYIKNKIVTNQKHQLIIDPNLDAFEVVKQNFLMRFKEALSNDNLFSEVKIIQKVRQSEKAMDIFIKTIGLIPDKGNNEILNLLLSKYKHLNENNVKLIGELLIPSLKQTIERMLRNEIDLETADMEMQYKFNIIKYGIKGE